MNGASYTLQVPYTDSDPWQAYRPPMGSLSAAEMFLERLPAHLLPARIIDTDGNVIRERA